MALILRKSSPGTETGRVSSAVPQESNTPKAGTMLLKKVPSSPFLVNKGGEFPDKNAALFYTQNKEPVGGTPTGRITSNEPQSQTIKPATGLVIKPKAVIRPVGKPLVIGATPTQRQLDNLEDAGLGLAPVKTTPPILSGPAYEKCFINTRVTITNGMFPWVKHYKPGDSGLVTHIGNNKDPMGIDDTSHLMHVIKIDKQADGKKDRIGQTAALFRWEFQIGEIKTPANWEGRKVVYE